MLGHASAAITMDLYGHLADGNLWQAARVVGGILLSYPGLPRARRRRDRGGKKVQVVAGFQLEPPIGIEPMTYALREARPRASCTP